ncbi:hemerythrin domain-containing protein [Streptomyces niger]|uniref:hemerythrin domain-containing protein n=1 Tax=Streptomyces niger TaxID=66373 RepID=UPI00069AB2A4|nr:hemerythrin domain-containing protein [Streptomyces niger]
MGHGGNVIDELTTDHREVEEIFSRIEALPVGDPQRKELADQATIELVRHSIAEEMHLYPMARRCLANGDSVADKELEDHSAAEHIMKQLESCQADEPAFDRLISFLMSEIRNHVEDEENNLFPRLRQAASAAELDEMGEKIRRAKKTAPTRPHPATPSTPPVNKILAPGTGLVDRARDALSGRGKSH